MFISFGFSDVHSAITFLHIKIGATFKAGIRELKPQKVSSCVDILHTFLMFPICDSGGAFDESTRVTKKWPSRTCLLSNPSSICTFFQRFSISSERLQLRSKTQVFKKNQSLKNVFKHSSYGRNGINLEVRIYHICIFHYFSLMLRGTTLASM